MGRRRGDLSQCGWLNDLRSRSQQSGGEPGRWPRFLALDQGPKSRNVCRVPLLECLRVDCSPGCLIAPKGNLWVEVYLGVVEKWNPGGDGNCLELGDGFFPEVIGVSSAAGPRGAGGSGAPGLVRGGGGKSRNKPRIGPHKVCWINQKARELEIGCFLARKSPPPPASPHV